MLPCAIPLHTPSHIFISPAESKITTTYMGIICQLNIYPQCRFLPGFLFQSADARRKHRHDELWHRQSYVADERRTRRARTTNVHRTNTKIHTRFVKNATATVRFKRHIVFYGIFLRQLLGLSTCQFVIPKTMKNALLT